MSFVDEATITARSGDGGNGCVSFRREKFIPRGGPDGGDGGGGGSVFILASSRLISLSEYRRRRRMRAADGRPGRGRQRTGGNGKDLTIEVPLGTVVTDAATGEIVADLVSDGERTLLLAGGRGGKGNRHFASSTNRAPRFAQAGTPGQEKTFILTLKSIADIGIVGLPNAGKSSLLSRLTTATPRIADYPFTTLAPNLGITELEDGRRVILADIPGLIEGAGKGRGLGRRFLQHIERTSLLLHVIDISRATEADPLEDFHVLRTEMNEYNPALSDKPFIVVLNKIDLLPPDHDRVPAAICNEFAGKGITSAAVSALTGQGIENLKELLALQPDGGGRFSP
jgi:GTPase